MSRRNFADGVELVREDLNAIPKAQERMLFDRLLYEIVQRKEDAFFDDSFLTEFATSTSVTVRPGAGFQTDSSQSNPEPEKRLLYNEASASLSISAPDPSLDRIDIVCVKAALADDLTANRKYKDAISGAVSTESLVVQQDWQAEMQIVAGTPAASPVAPSTPSGYIKIAELAVTTVSGLAGAGAVTDTRESMPVGSETLINTIGYDRLTESSTSALKDLLAEIDTFIKQGYFSYCDWDDRSTDPDAPANGSGKIRMYVKDGTLYGRAEAPGGSIAPLGGGGGGGGGGAVWNAPDGSAPLETDENGEKVWLFQSGLSQKLVMFLKVPQTYLSGRQIKLYAGHYSPSAANTILIKAQSYLIRKNNDAIDSTANGHTSTNTALTNTVANQYREGIIDISDSDGKLNSVAVSPGDLIRVELSRDTDTDTADIRFIPSSTEFTFV